MPDIAMCMNNGCPMRNKCYRWAATPHPLRQTYADFVYDLDAGCDAFMPMYSMTQRKKTNRENKGDD